jgi:2-polyprenyl-3-methyl-5-hydroxy-6-metoxy-1,4-benzoquinol methylase
MAEFSFSKLTPEVISATMLEAACRPKREDVIESEGLAPPILQLCAPLPVTKAMGLLEQAREKSPPSGWRYFFRALRRQPRVNGLIFRVLAEVIKISRRSNKLMEGLHEQIDFARYQATGTQERIRHVVQTDSKRQEELAALRQTLVKMQDQQSARILSLEETLLRIQKEQREELAKLTQTLMETQSQHREGVAALTRTMSEEMHSFLEAQRKTLEQQHASLLAMIEEAKGRADSVAGEISAFQRRIGSELNEVRARLLRADLALQRLRKTRSPARSTRSTVIPRSGAPEDKAHTAIEEKFDYFMFEQRFRGDMTEIKQRQESYVDFFRGRRNVVDLGCGRGEFVELLSEQGIPATGIDMNEEMIESCQARGLKVVLAGLFEYLESRPDRSIGGIFSAQVVEHLSSNQIMRLVELCGTKLEAGGIVVVETINANCLYALGNFYLDPTHVKPVPCNLLQFMFEQAGFEIRETRFSGPVAGIKAEPVLRSSGGVPVNFENYQDYAIIALRPS